MGPYKYIEVVLNWGTTHQRPAFNIHYWERTRMPLLKELPLEKYLVGIIWKYVGEFLVVTTAGRGEVYKLHSVPKGEVC